MRGGDDTPSECTGLPHPTTRHGRVDSLSGLYFEPQVKSYCQFHSINGLMGKPLVDGAEFVTTMSAVLDADKAAVRPLFDKDVSWKLNGSCSDIALNHYLHQVLQTQDGAAVTLYTIPQHIQRGCTQEQVLQHVPTGQINFLMSKDTDSGGHTV